MGRDVFDGELGVWREGVHGCCSGRQVGSSGTTRENVVLQNLHSGAASVSILPSCAFISLVSSSSKNKKPHHHRQYTTTYVLKKRLEVVGNGIGSDLLHKRRVPKAGERVVGRGKQRELASALQGFDQPRAGNQSLESGVSCRIHNNVHDGGRLLVLVWLAARSILDLFLVGAGLASRCRPRLERGQGSRTASRPQTEA